MRGAEQRAQRGLQRRCANGGRRCQNGERIARLGETDAKAVVAQDAGEARKAAAHCEADGSVILRWRPKAALEG